MIKLQPLLLEAGLNKFEDYVDDEIQQRDERISDYRNKHKEAIKIKEEILRDKLFIEFCNANDIDYTVRIKPDYDLTYAKDAIIIAFYSSNIMKLNTDEYNKLQKMVQRFNRRKCDYNNTGDFNLIIY